jgi:hypothetical protein
MGSVPQDLGPTRRCARASAPPSSPIPRDTQCRFSCVAAWATAGVRALWRRRSRITISKPPPYRGRWQKHSSLTKIGAHIEFLLERCFVDRLLIFAIGVQTRGLLEMLLATEKCIFSARTPIPVNQHVVQELEARWYGSEFLPIEECRARGCVSFHMGLEPKKDMPMKALLSNQPI